MQQQRENPFISGLLRQFQHDESEATREVLDRLAASSEHRFDYLSTFNLLLNTRNSHTRQRRDVAAIARLIADSDLFARLEGEIAGEAKESRSTESGSTTLEVTKLIGNICNENPHFIDNILASSASLLDLLFSLYSRAESTPHQAEGLTAVLSFLHNVSLKESNVRLEKVGPCLEALLENVLTHDKFSAFISHKKFQNFVNSLFKFHSNVSLVATHAYHSLIRAARSLNQEYKRLAESYKIASQRTSVREERTLVLERAQFADRKLIAIMKLFQRARPGLFAKLSAFSFTGLLKIFVKIAIMRPVALLAQPLENKLLITLINDLMLSIQDHHDRLLESHPLPNNNPPAGEIEEEEGELQPPVEEEKLASSPSLLQRLRCEARSFETIAEVSKHFSDTYFRIIQSTIETLLVSFECLRFSQVREGVVAEAVEHSRFLISILTVRLQRILSWMIKLFPLEQLKKGNYYRQIVILLLRLVPFYFQSAAEAENAAILEELNNMSEVTTESEGSAMRYIMETLEEESVKTFIQGKLLEKINIFSTAYEIIIKFVYHLTDDEDFLRYNVAIFIHPFINDLQKNHLDPIRKCDRLVFKQIQVLRLAMKMVTEFMHGGTNPSYEEQKKQKTRIYRYCRLIYAGEGLFCFFAGILNLLEKHRIENTADLLDTLQNRQLVVHTIFAKIAIQRAKTFANALTNPHAHANLRLGPDFTGAELDKVKEYYTETYEGYFGYLKAISELVRRACPGARQVPFKEEIMGTVLSRTLEYGLFVEDSFGNSEELAVHEAGLVKVLKRVVDGEAEGLMQWLFQSSDQHIHRLPLLVKKILHFEKRELRGVLGFQEVVHQEQMQHIQNFLLNLSQQFTRSSLLLTGRRPDLKMKVRKTWKVGEVNIAGEVQRVSNLLVMLGELVRLLAVEGCFQPSQPQVAPNYLYSILDLVKTILQRYDAETHFPTQADSLLHGSLWLVETYLLYHTQLKEASATRQQDSLAKRKMLKRERKERLKTEKAEQHNPNPNLTKKKKRNKKKKTRKIFQVEEQKGMTRSASKNNLLQKSQAKQISLKKRQKRGQLQQTVRKYLFFVVNLLGGSTNPLIKNETLSYLLYFISRHMHRSMVQNPPYHQFQISLGELIAPLLRVKVRDERIPGYHLSLCKLALQLFDEAHIRVDYELAIKRFLYENSDDKLPLVKFQKMLRENFRAISPSTAALVEVTYPDNPKRDQFVPTVYEPLLQAGAPPAFIEPKEGVELHLICRPDASKRKPSGHEEKLLKVSDYCPEGELFIFVQQVIAHSIRTVIAQLDHGYSIEDFEALPYSKDMEPFTIRAALQTLQYLARESPSLGPFIAKFKCKKLLQTELAAEGLKNKEKISGIVQKLLTGQAQGELQEIGFLSVLLRLFSPLMVNAISGLLFQLCLDSTPLVQVTEGKDKPGKTVYLPFGSVVRLKVAEEVENIIFGADQPIYRRLCLLNLVTVLINIREMTKLLLQNGFVAKAYKGLQAVRTQLGELSGNLVTRLLAPFYLAPMGVLQQLNIYFQYAKKTGKGAPKISIRTVQSRQSINAQLIPMESLKRFKFKLDWPYSVQRQNPLDAPQQHEEHQIYAQANSQDSQSLSQQSYQSLDSQDNSSYMRYSQLQQHMPDSAEFNEYISEQPHQQLLNEEWEYSDSPDQYPIEEDDHVIEIDHEGPQDEEEEEEGEEAGEQDIDDYLQGVSEGYLEEGSDDGMEQSLIHRLDMESLSHPAQDIMLRAERDFTMNEVKQQDYYLNVNAMLNFQKVESIPRISKVQKRQVHLLRFFLQIIIFPLRKAYNNRFPRTLTQHEIKEEKLVEECADLGKAFIGDELIRMAEFVEYNQIYRYDHFHKETPLLSEEVERQFADQPDIVRNHFRRRGGFIHNNRQNLIEILPGWNITEVINEEPDHDHNFDDTPQVPPMEHNEEGSMLHIDSEDGGEQQQEGEDEEMEAIEGMEEEMEEQMEQEMDEEQHRANIDAILRNSNLGMTTRQFMRLDPEIQHDILLNIAQHENGEAPNNTPVRSPPLVPVPPLNLRDHLQEEESLSHGRVIEARQPRIVRQISEEDQPEQPEAIVPEEQPEQQQIQPEIQINGAHNVDEVYRKMSLQHSKKITKDVIQALNKDGKNNSKFYELEENELQSLLSIFFLTNEVQHSKYPYPLVQTICINTHNLRRLLSNLILLLHLTPARFTYRPGHNVLRIGNEEGQREDYAEKVYPRLVLKILHLLTHLTRNYSIAMGLLRVNCEVTQSLKEWERPEQSHASSFQLLILLSRERAVGESPMVLSFLIGVLDNVTMHHFYKNVHKIVAEKGEEDRQEFKVGKVGEESVNLLGELLQSDFVGDNLALVSKIIMRLSVEEENLKSFIRYLEQLVRQLTDLALKEVGSEGKVEGGGKPKIINLMAIFYEMVKAFQTYPTSLQRHLEVLASLRKIVEYDQLQALCEQAVRILFAGSGKEPYSRVGEVVDCFFVLHEIATITSGRGEKHSNDEGKHNRIAELGEVGLAELRRSQVVAEEQELVLGAFNLTKLWRESAGHPNFKLYVNDNIRRKLAEAAAHPRRASVFDMPIIKIAAATPHLLSFDNKYALFKAELRRLRGKDKAQTLHISLRREDVFEDSFESIFPRSIEQLRGKLKIEFRGEEGEDAGGVTREWFQLLSREMFNANYGLFKSGSGGHTYHPSPTSYFNERHLDYFKFIGRVAGKALYDGYLLDAYFTPAFYKHILHLPITYRDMEQQDYEYFKSLTWILENSPIDEFLELNFTYDCDNFGEIETRELIPGGAGITVTEQNKLQYVQLIAYAKMATSIRPQLQAFLTGLHELVPHRLLSVFSEKQLEIMISGRPTIDIQDLRRHTDLVNYMRNDPIIVWLFQVLEGFDMQLRTAFIQFVTGSSRVPVQGFKDLRGMNGVQRFNIHREFQEERLPRAHTCFNQLDLPNYRSKEILVEKLMYAITEGKEGFGMI